MSDMMSSRVASRIVVAVGLAVVFGIGIVSIFVVPAKPGAQNQVAHHAPPAAASSDQTVTNSPAPNAAAPDQTAPGASASAPNAATAPVAPPAVSSPNDANEKTARRAMTRVCPSQGTRALMVPRRAIIMIRSHRAVLAMTVRYESRQPLM